MEDLSVKLISIFQSCGLQSAEGIQFHEFNLAIGKNGSGKTRFLKAIEAYYRENPLANTEIVTLYFPEISSFFSTEDNQMLEENITAELESAIFHNDSLNFQDFLKLAQRDSVAFLNDFFMYMSARLQKTKQRYKEDFGHLNEQLRRFLGWVLDESSVDKKPVGRKLMDGQPSDELPLVDMLKAFSPGELMLFYLSLFLFYLEHVRNSNLILIIDEPEQHLHPKALISLMETLLKEKPITQLWIASHSLFLLPLFEFEQLVYINQNKILKLNRNTYHDIYNDLIGLENIDMYELMRSVENWTYYQFITENFLLPSSKDTVSTGDEQFQKLLHSLQLIQSTRPLNVLDYGAGKFRIWECFRLELPNAEERARFLNYEAYEPHLDDKIKCPDSIRLYEKEDELPQGQYDVVVLMNVLHEIEPTKWCQNFETIHRILAEHGVLVFLEVLSLTNGEQPYGDAGYLLLQDQETKFLFPNAQRTHLKDKNKSNCWVIPRSDLAGITLQNVTEAIGRLEKNCEAQLEQLDQERIALAHRNNKDEAVNVKVTARQYAFLAQQYINAHIAFKHLSQNRFNKPSSAKRYNFERLPIRELKP